MREKSPSRLGEPSGDALSRNARRGLAPSLEIACPEKPPENSLAGHAICAHSSNGQNVGLRTRNLPVRVRLGALTLSYPRIVSGYPFPLFEFGAWLSPVRALGSGPRSRWFKSTRPDYVFRVSVLVWI